MPLKFFVFIFSIFSSARNLSKDISAISWANLPNIFFNGVFAGDIFDVALERIITESLEQFLEEFLAEFLYKSL